MQSKHWFISEARETNYRMSQAAHRAGVDSAGSWSRCCSSEHGQRMHSCKYSNRTKKQKHPTRYHLARAFLFSSAKCKHCVLISCVCQDLVAKWYF
ncbi:rCG40826 [Rattus norvegicus]|uniref:RCG40826 n=1 Tax=Rattus norvegicus TaxID=10116 RepID=A6KS01_RAT|nr:rCG40826 [Rattus norvegicus]